ncbi:MAG: C2 family cysteine protease [Isosphaeraceae bacterium]
MPITTTARRRQFTLAGNGSAATTGGITAVSRASNTMEVFWVGPQGSVQDAYYYDGAGWRGFTLAGNGSASPRGGIKAVSRASNTMEVFWVGAQGSVQDAYYYDGAGWKGFTLAGNGSAATTGGITAVSRASNTMEVFWVGPQGSVQDAYYYDGAGWKGFTLAPAGSASITGGIKAVARASNTMELWWAGADNSVQDAYFYNNTGWNRFQLEPAIPANPAAATAYSAPPAGTSLYNGGAPSYLDVTQGAVGDCWLLSSLAEAAFRQPSLITSMFTYDGTTVVNGSSVGMYTVRLFDTKGFPVFIQVDASLPSGGSYYDRVTNGLGTKSLWVALAEKAYAMANGMGYVTTSNPNQNSYAALNGGWPSWALSAITGRPAAEYNTNTNDIVSAWNSGKLVVLCTSTPTSSYIVGSHCYAMVGYTSGAAQPFKMYNPWGTDANGWAPGNANTKFGLFTANAAFIAQNFTKESFGSASNDGKVVSLTTVESTTTHRDAARRRGGTFVVSVFAPKFSMLLHA